MYSEFLTEAQRFLADTLRFLTFPCDLFRRRCGATTVLAIRYDTLRRRYGGVAVPAADL